MDVDNYSEAHKKYLKALKINPNYCDAMFNISLAKFLMHDLSGALEMLRKLEKIEQNRIDIFLVHGRIASEYIKLLAEEQRKCVFAAIGIDPNNKGITDLVADINSKIALIEASFGSLGEKLQGNGEVYRTKNQDENKLTVEREEVTRNMLRKSSVNLGSVVGMQHAKKVLNDEFRLLRASESGKYGNMFQNTGIILYGPPGVGKTRLVLAFAGQHNLPVYTVRINEVLDMWTGNSEKNLQKIFDAAIRDPPSLIVIDEIDALGRERLSRDGSDRTLVNQFIVSMDRLREEGKGVMVMGTTNRPFDVDQALRRGGRFQTEIYVQPPDFRDRVELFSFFLSEFELSHDNEAMEILARETELYTPADIEKICREVLLNYVIDNPESIKPEITLNNVLSTIMGYRAGGRTVKLWYERLKESMGKDWFDFEYPELAEDVMKFSKV